MPVGCDGVDLDGRRDRGRVADVVGAGQRVAGSSSRRRSPGSRCPRSTSARCTAPPEPGSPQVFFASVADCTVSVEDARPDWLGALRLFVVGAGADREAGRGARARAAARARGGAVDRSGRRPSARWSRRRRSAPSPRSCCPRRRRRSRCVPRRSAPRRRPSTSRSSSANGPAAGVDDGLGGVVQCEAPSSGNVAEAAPEPESPTVSRSVNEPAERAREVERAAAHEGVRRARRRATASRSGPSCRLSPAARLRRLDVAGVVGRPVADRVLRRPGSRPRCPCRFSPLRRRAGSCCSRRPRRRRRR